VEAIVFDATGSMRATFFNQPWLVERYPPGTRLLLHGKADARGGFRVSHHAVGADGGIAAPEPGDAVAHYPAAVGITSTQILTLVQTDKLSKQIGVVLYGREYWEQVLDLKPMAEWGAIAEKDLELRGEGQLLGTRQSGLSDLRFETVEVIEGRANTVVVVARLAGRGRASGVDVVALGASVWTLREGMVTSLTLYQTREEALEAVGLSK